MMKNFLHKIKSLNLYWKIIISLILLVIILNLLGLSNSFCDFYIDNIFGIWVNTYGRFSNLFTFSLGEILIAIGIIILIVAVVSGILLIFLRKKSRYRRYAKGFYKFFLGVITGILLIMTLNCSLLYGASPMEINPNDPDREYTLEELETLRNYIVEQANELALSMERDEYGYIIYNGHIETEVTDAMINLSKDFPRLGGYYPHMKPINASVFMTQTYTSGVYFPFSMEANYNDMMYIVNYPGVFAHEYCHLKGYIFEDEANFLAYLACIGSNDPFIRYCGYSHVIGYVDDAYYESAGEDRYNTQVAVDPLVWDDYIFLTPDNWEVVEEESPLDTSTVDEISDTVTDNSLKFFGVEDGIASYDRVTELLLEYYIGGELIN